jgi:hypothetical protein
MKSVKWLKDQVEAPSGFEPLNKGFADLPPSTQNQQDSSPSRISGPTQAPHGSIFALIFARALDAVYPPRRLAR